ncbi:acyltransferase family protein [Altericista sp. CCNU0014]|uniref:acyltransferase family protein n=1 Tax=Altericista sp. CCNU0014 TaxID=3082949 RepID=UPI003850A0F3
MNHSESLLASQKIKYDSNLEGLRGLAALIVGISHIFGIKHLLDPDYHPDLFWLNTGKSAVLIFFIMSGYVIGLTNQTSYSPLQAKQYLLRRMVRLVPIYIIAVILGVIAIPQTNILAIFGNLFFLQNILVPRIEGNSPIWSINYEVIYYLLFLLIWWLRPPLKFVILFCLSISILGWFSSPIPDVLCSYASGFIFWVLGLWLAWRVKINREVFSKIPLFSYLLLFYSLHNFQFGSVILHGLGMAGASNSQVSLADLIGAMPICIVMMAAITHRPFIGFKWINRFCFLLPALMSLFLVLTGRIGEERWLSAVVLYVLALVLMGWKLDCKRLSSLAFWGRISYGFYLVHFPFILIIQVYFPLAGSWTIFCLRAILWFALSTVISVLLELVFQPIIKRWCTQRNWFASSAS